MSIESRVLLPKDPKKHPNDEEFLECYDVKNLGGTLVIQILASKNILLPLLYAFLALLDTKLKILMQTRYNDEVSEYTVDDSNSDYKHLINAIEANREWFLNDKNLFFEIYDADERSWITLENNKVIEISLREGKHDCLSVIEAILASFGINKEDLEEEEEPLTSYFLDDEDQISPEECAQRIKTILNSFLF